MNDEIVPGRDETPMSGPLCDAGGSGGVLVVMRSLGLILALALAAPAAAAGSALSSPAGAPSCGTYRGGPAGLGHGAVGGPECLLDAYRAHCRAAGYRLSIFGVDTSAVYDFRLVDRGGRCTIAVTSTFRVFPRPARAPIAGVCSSLARRGGGVVARGCTGKDLASTISLTGTS